MNEASKKVEEKKKSWKRFILPVVVVLLVMGLFNLWVQLKFFMSDDLQIQLEPRQYVVAQKEGNLSLSFDINVKSFQFCKPLCNFTLRRANDFGLVDFESRDFVSNLPIKKQYNFPSDFNGQGQTMYYFDVSCQNQKSLLCKTDGKIRSRNALVTVNHNYSLSQFALLRSVKKRIDDFDEELAKQFVFENNTNNLTKKIRETVQTSKETTTLVGSQFYLLNQAKDKYEEQDFSGADSLLEKIYVPDMESEWISIKNELFQFNQNVLNLKFLLNNTFDEIYSFYQKTNSTKATQLKAIYDLIDSEPKSSFEDIQKISGLSAIKLGVNNLTKNYISQKQAYEVNLNSDVNSVYSLLNLSRSLVGDTCLDIELVNQGIQTHNQNLLPYDVSLQTYLDFINDSLPQISSNSTHLISSSQSIPNDSGKTLNQLIDYVKIDEFDYCLPQPTLYSKSFTVPQINFDTSVNLSASEVLGMPAPKCCIYGVCTHCEDTPYPVLFLHGHAVNKDNPPESSINAFVKIQSRLSSDELIVNAGDIDYDSVGGEKLWSKMSIPLGVRATYYYVSYYDSSILSTTIQKEEGVESYSIRLKEVIDLILNQTGSDKLIIVAHSMGGLVTRNYLMLFGESKVDRVLMIATPNNGLSDRAEKSCGYFGDQKSCTDMAKGSIFLRKLSFFKPKIPVGVIAGVGCETDGGQGDGIVSIKSAELDYAKMYYVTGTCNDFLKTSLHKDLLDPDLYPGVYQTVKDFITTPDFLK